jgi:hypothetical protein
MRDDFFNKKAVFKEDTLPDFSAYHFPAEGQISNSLRDLPAHGHEIFSLIPGGDEIKRKN